MKLRKIPGKPVPPTIEFVFNREEAELIREILGKFSTNSFAAHMGADKNSDVTRKKIHLIDSIWGSLGRVLND